MKRIYYCLAIVLFWTACTAAETITLTDMAERKVTAPVDPARIICLGPGALRLIVYLQAAEKVAGVEQMEKNSPSGRPYWIAHPELRRLPSCGPGGPSGINKKPDLEAVLATAPQVIFTTYMEENLADEIQRMLNIPVVALSYGQLATFDEAVYKALRIAGTVLKRTVRAETVIEYIETQRKQLQQRVADIAPDKRPEAYVGGIGFRGTQGIESSDRSYPPFEWTHAVNLAQKITNLGAVKSHLFVEKEHLLNLNPEVIFIDGGGLAHVSAEFTKQRRFYNSLRAVTHKKVYCLLPFNWYTTNIDTALCDAWAVAKILYPQRFADIDLGSKADEIYTFMVGKPVYAQMKADFCELGRIPSFLK